MTIRIALIHAVTVAMAPVHEAFRRLWPEAECCNILDASLSLDREGVGELTAAMRRRIGDRAAHRDAGNLCAECRLDGRRVPRYRGSRPVSSDNRNLLRAGRDGRTE